MSKAPESTPRGSSQRPQSGMAVGVFCAMMLLWMAIILALTHWPHPPKLPTGLPHIDKIVHFCMYAVLGFLAGATVLRLSPAQRKWRTYIWAGVVVFAILDELTQSLLPTRNSELYDWAADIIGLSAGAAALLGRRLLMRRRTATPMGH